MIHNLSSIGKAKPMSGSMVGSECERWGATAPTCDDVFERLTSGPFPSGPFPGGATSEVTNTATGQATRSAWSDEATERHLACCHDCRRLAEALRPAVSALCDARDAGPQPVYDAVLPAYDGVLPGDARSRFLGLRPWLQAADGEAIGVGATTTPSLSPNRPTAMRSPQAWSIVAALTSALALACVACAAGGLFGSRESEQSSLAVPTSRVHWVASESCKAVREWEAAGGGARNGLASGGGPSGGLARVGDDGAPSGVIGKLLMEDRGECCTQCHAADVEARVRVEPARLLAACLACHTH